MDVIITEKKCTKCKEIKSLDDFNNTKRNKSGKVAACKKCCLELQKDWRHRNPEKARAQCRKWYSENKEYNVQRAKKWASENPEKHNKAVDDWHKAHREKGLVATRKWSNNNKDKELERTRRWRANNPEKARLCTENRRARKINAEGSVSTKEWKELCKKYGNKCLCCGKHEITMDHIVPLSEGGPNTIDNCQPLCGSCNSRKHTKTIDYRP